jgi:hypothetical protein
LGIASFILGLISIFILAPILVPISVCLGIGALFNRQIGWGILGIFLACIGFITSPILMGITAVAGASAIISHELTPSSLTKKLDTDASLIEGAKLCTKYLPNYERQFHIPAHLLAAISSVESGRYNNALGLNLPWPWTVHSNGKVYYFNTKYDAINTVNKLTMQGTKNIEIGCMQINLQQHTNEIAILEEAFNPSYNIAYAAQLLEHNFEITHSWRQAIAEYPSSTGMQGEQYADAVYIAWSQIINKVSDAKAGKPILNLAN